jgi:hypothetical protein
MVSIVTDQVTQSSLGTGVAETRLNNDTSYIVPSWAKQLIEFTPQQYPTGAVTAAQSFTPKFKIKSVSIGGLEPKEIVIAPISAMLGATSSNTTPVLRSFKLNRNLPGQNINIDFYGQNLVANTVANAGMATVKLSSMATTEREQFYLASTDETDSGTTAATIAGGAITLNGALALNMWYGQLMPVTVVASESYAGYMELTSPDFSEVQRIRYAPYQITTGLSTLITTIVPDQMYYEGWCPVNSTVTIANNFIQTETVNAAYDFINGVGFVRSTPQHT